MSPESSSPVRILLVEDHPIVRLGVRQMISADPGLSICGETDSADAALAMATSTSADLVIVDLSLAQGAGLALVATLRDAIPALPVLVLSMHDEVLFAERALRAGARGYIMKREAIDGLVGAIRCVLGGRIYLSDQMAQEVLERAGQGAPAPGDSLQTLTNRELEVFDLVGQGVKTAAIAKRLGVSVKTVETYRSNIKTKLNLKSAADLIRFAATRREQP